MTMPAIYLLSSPPPKIRATDAVSQEAETLRAHFGGELRHLTPFSSPSTTLPLSLYGLHLLPMLWRSSYDRLHVFHSGLYDFPALRSTRQSIVYTVTAGVDPRRLPRRDLVSRLTHIVVPTEMDRETLMQWGARPDRVSVIVPGIDRARFRPLEPFVGRGGNGNRSDSDDGGTGGEFVLFAGSAPWTEAQFDSKGVDALLELARELPELRLVMLWRGILREALLERVRRRGLESRVEIHEDRVDVKALLGRVHAGVVLARDRELVKAYPHSLLESLACGRPVLCSEAISLSGYVAERECGVVVQEVSVTAVRDAVRELRRRYDHYRSGALSLGEREFSTTAMIEAYEDVYRDAREAVGAY